MAAQVLTFFNQSGGVGKSTLTYNIGYLLAELHDRRVLLVDLDSQCSLTFFMGLQPHEIEKTIYDALRYGEDLPIQRNLSLDDYDLKMDLLPGSIFLSRLTLDKYYAAVQALFKIKINDLLSTSKGTWDGKTLGELFEDRGVNANTLFEFDQDLAEALLTVQDQYDFILIDSPPSLGLLSILGMVAASYLVVPIHTEYKSLEGTMFLVNTITEMIGEIGRNIPVAGIVPTMYQRNTEEGRYALEFINRAYSELKNHMSFSKAVLFPEIRRSIDVSAASRAHLPLMLFKPNHDVIKPLKKIANTLDALVWPNL